MTDEIALKTTWQPMIEGGANFQVLKLKKRSDARIDFVPTYFAIIFFFIFLGLGTLFLWMLITGNNHQTFVTVMLAILGCSFFAFSVNALFFRKIKCSLIGKNGQWTFYKESILMPGMKLVSSKNIYAIQILQKMIRGEDSDYPCYELNLVYGDASRQNIYNQGNYKALMKDVSVLEQVLKIPVWNTVQMSQPSAG